MSTDHTSGDDLSHLSVAELEAALDDGSGPCPECGERGGWHDVWCDTGNRSDDAA